MTLSIPSDLRDAMVDTLVDATDAGSGPGVLEIRSGTRPATADAAATGTLLVSFTLADPAFGASASGVATLDADPDIEVDASNTGTATWARVKDSDGTTVFDGSVGTSGADFNITSTAITSGQGVALISGTITLPA